jgi:hypothetical protein
VDGKRKLRSGRQADPSLNQGLRALLDYAEREARIAGLRLTAQLIGAAALSVADSQLGSQGGETESLPPIPRDRMH